jgi:hypothetical protein
MPHTPLREPLAKWSDRGACRGMDRDLFFPDPYKPVPPEAIQACARCIVRAECFDWAVRHDEQGYWGGTMPEARKRVTRSRSRIKCPHCRSRALMRMGERQSCVACGLSWSTVAYHTLEKGEAA